MSCSFRRKSLVSCMYDRPVLTMGVRKLSTKADTLSVGLSLAETIGLPGTGMMLLWIFGSKYSWMCEVL